MRSFARERPFLTYYLLALAIAILVTIVSEVWGKKTPAGDPLSYFHFAASHHMVLNTISIVSFGFTTGGPFVFLVLVFGGAPTISAFITAALAWGGRGVRRLLSRLKPWRRGVTARQGLRVYAVMIGLYLIGLGFALWYTKSHGTAEQWKLTWSALGGTPLFALLIGLVSLFFDEGASFEEMGWRGFALPYLQQKMRVPLAAAIVLGILWWAWHLPREMPAIISGHGWLGGAFNPLVWARGESMFALYVVLLSIVIAYACNLTGGSVWPGIFIHAGTNAWNKTYALDALYKQTHWPIDLRAVFMLAVVILVVIFAGPRLGLRPDADGIEGT